MRLLLYFQSQNNSAYDLRYNHKLQGFIYNLIKETPYSALHDKRGYKFLCFSNIMPPKNIKKGEKRTLIISSPDNALIKFLNERLKEEKEINIGEMMFKLEDTLLLKPIIQKDCTLISGTPIIIRTAKKNYEKYGIISKYDYIYWRKQYPFEIFIEQLEANLFKKYNEFHKTKNEEFKIFEQFIFKKEVCNHIIINGKEQKVFGSIWQFIFNNLDEKRKEILQFGLDCGFGEMNSFGFGFMNIQIRITKDHG